VSGLGSCKKGSWSPCSGVSMTADDSEYCSGVSMTADDSESPMNPPTQQGASCTSAVTDTPLQDTSDVTCLRLVLRQILSEVMGVSKTDQKSHRLQF